LELPPHFFPPTFFDPPHLGLPPLIREAVPATPTLGLAGATFELAVIGAGAVVILYITKLFFFVIDGTFRFMIKVK
jgi:hypothetical protein